MFHFSISRQNYENCMSWVKRQRLNCRIVVCSARLLRNELAAHPLMGEGGPKIVQIVISGYYVTSLAI